MQKILAVLLIGAAPVLAGNYVDKAEKQLALGEKALLKLAKAKGDSKRLKALKAARPYFARALKKARHGLSHAPAKDLPPLQATERKATGRLVAVLNAQTILYLRRGSMSNARKANAAALALVPNDEKAKELADEVDDPPADELLAGYSSDAFGDAAALQDLLRNRTQAQKRYGARRRPAPR